MPIIVLTLLPSLTCLYHYGTLSSTFSGSTHQPELYESIAATRGRRTGFTNIYGVKLQERFGFTPDTLSYARYAIAHAFSPTLH
jgi:hypothetical protein